MNTHDQKSQLTIKNKEYRQYLDQFFKLNFEKNDITTKTVVTKKIVIATITAKESGILAGREEAEYFLPELKFTIKDGDKIRKKQIIATIKAENHKILQYERLILNLLMRMSGLATNTRTITSKSKIKIAATRKTQWALLDKKAISIGGGLTHRLDLADAILIKENHLIGTSISEALQKAEKQRKKVRFIEIEVETEKQALEASKWPHPLTIMLDNFSPIQIQKTLAKIPKPDRNRHQFEASGGITPKNLQNYQGVDLISMSCLTNGVKSLDMSLRIMD